MAAEFAGDYSLKSVMFIKNNIESEIKDLVNEINIYSSVNSVAISADMVISDPKNLIQSLPIQGGEEIVITIGTNNDKFVLYFVLYKIDSKVTQEKSSAYIVRLCTTDSIKNESSRHSVRIKNKFSENVVTELLKDKLKTNKPIDVDKSVYPLNFIIPNYRTFDTCLWLARKSVPRQNVESCGFLFFETLKGYKFKSIDNLFSRRSENEQTPFTYTPSKTNAVDKNYRIVKYSSTEKYFDILSEIRMGNLAHYTQKIDFTQRTLSLTKSSLQTVWKHMSHLGGGGIPTDVNNKSISNPSRVIYTLIINNLFGNSVVYEGDDDKINKLIDRSVYRYQTFDYYQIDIEIAGNLGLEVGKVYNLLFPSPNSDSSANRNRMADDGLSGTWMCHSLKHTINRTRAITIARFCRDSNGSEVNTNITISNTIDNTIFNIGNIA